MKQKLLQIHRHLPWLFLLFAVDGFAALLLWLANVYAFLVLFSVIVLTTFLLFAALLSILIRREEKKRQAFQSFLETPDAYHEENLAKTVSAAEASSIRLLGALLRKKQLACDQAACDLVDYEEYIEAWAHETKTPLSLLTMLLDNRRDEIPPAVYFRLDYVQSQMQEYISQMLYYARLKSARKDYLFEHLDLHLCLAEVLEDYKPLLEEKNFHICNGTPHIQVYTDRRGIRFLLGQLVSNAIKYSGASPQLTISLKQQEDKDALHIHDNGIGVRCCDLPYIFEKGFTGDSNDNRKKATGMGLYLSKKLADDLNLTLEAQSEWRKGFEMTITFPKV